MPLFIYSIFKLQSRQSGFKVSATNESKNKLKYNLDRPIILQIPNKHSPNTGLSFRAEGQGFSPSYCKSYPQLLP